RHPDRRRGGDRDRVQHPRARPPHHLGGAPSRLPGDPGRGAPDRRRLHARQPGGRSRLPRDRPADPGPVSSTVVSRRVVIAAPEPTVRWLGLRIFLRRKTAVIGVVVVALNVLVALGAPALSRWDPQMLDVKARLTAPNATHWFGTDDVGRDVWS